MKTLTFETTQEWMNGRRGKVTGTRLKDLIVKRGTGKKKGYYELIAERIAIPREENENVMDRGHTLEEEAILRLSEETGLKFVHSDNEIWVRDDNENIAYSPDGYVKSKKIQILAEVKCLNQASHVEAYLTQKIPSEYHEQSLQGFVVNDNLKTLYFCFYDPTMPMDFFHIKIERADVAEEVAMLLDLQKETLQEIEEISNSLIKL